VRKIFLKYILCSHVIHLMFNYQYYVCILTVTAFDILHYFADWILMWDIFLRHISKTRDYFRIIVYSHWFILLILKCANIFFLAWKGQWCSGPRSVLLTFQARKIPKYLKNVCIFLLKSLWRYLQIAPC